MHTKAHPAHLVHDELPTPHEMVADCRVVGANLSLERAARAAVSPAPSIRFEDYPAEIFKRDIEISDAAVRLANALQLHLD